jgi:hypothetical protein
VNGRIPEDRELMLDTIDDALAQPITAFRPPTEMLVGMAL